VELDAALNGELASDVRYSQTLNDELRYVAAPIVQNYQVVGAVRLSLSESAVEREIAITQAWLSLFVISVVIVAALTAWLLARSVTAPLRALATTARDLPNDLNLRAQTSGPSEVVEVAVALNSTADKLSRLIARTQRVAADASHHLRTPLTGIRLRLEAISDIASEAEVRTQADAAMNEVDRLTHRIEQVLDLAKTDAGSAPLADVDLAAVVAERVEAARTWSDAVDLEFDVSASTPCMVSTPIGVPAKIIDELLGNAHAYARSLITVSVHRQGPMCVITVSDDGPGIPEAERAGVFERFHRGSGAVAGGSGLGLALVREAAQACGGDAVIETSANGGASVVVSFPCVAADSTSVE
jgi:signal transduction histidine kinase